MSPIPTTASHRPNPRDVRGAGQYAGGAGAFRPGYMSRLAMNAPAAPVITAAAIIR